MTRQVAAALVVGLALLLPAGGAARGAARKPTVFAAASLTQVFQRIDRGARYSFAGSDQLAVQLQQGAPADVYAAASPKYTQLLYHKGLLRKPVAFATNRLIVLVPRSNPARIRSVYDLRRSGVKLVIGDRSVPIGAYTRQILDMLGISDSVLRNVVSEATDVKAIVAQVAFGQADAGFVYRTDAKPAAARTKVVSLPRRAQPPIRYEIAVVKASRNQAAARAFVQEVRSQRGRKLLVKAGFGLPSRQSPKR
jgi:molybdate transport system substrate-binding protein